MNANVPNKLCGRGERSLRLAIDGIDGLVGVLAPNGELEAANRQLSSFLAGRWKS